MAKDFNDEHQDIQAGLDAAAAAAQLALDEANAAEAVRQAAEAAAKPEK